MLSINVTNIGGLDGSNEFKFTEGLNIIRAPNASGKSSLINAFKLALSGPDFTNFKNLNEFLSDFKDSGLIHIKLNGNIVDLRIERKKDGKVVISDYKSNFNFLDDKLTRLIFFDQFSEIYQTIISGDSKKFQDWIANITDIKLYLIAKTLIDNKESELKTRLAHLTEQEAGKKEILGEQLHINTEELKKLKKEREKLLQTSEDTELKSKLQSINKEFDKITKGLKDFKKKKTNISQKLLKLNKEKSNIDLKIKEDIEKLEKVKIELLEVEGTIDKLENTLIKLEDENNSLRIELNGTIRKVNGKKRTIEGLREKLKAKERRRKNQRSLFNYIECPTCFQPLDQEILKTNVKKIDAEIKSLINEIEKREIKINLNKSQIDKIKNKLEKAKTELPNMKKSLEKQIEENNKVFKGINDEIAKLETKIPEIDRKISDLENKFESIQKKKKKLSVNLDKIRTEYTEIDQKIEDKKEEIEVLEEKIRKLEQDTEIVQNLKIKTQASNEIKNHFQKKIELIRNDIIGTINDEILNCFTLLELAEINYLSIEAGTYELEIRRKLGRKTELLELSAAERTLVALIILYITKRVLLPDVPLFFIDETANAFDDTRFQRIIHYLAKEVNTLILTKNEPFQGKRGEIITQKNIIHSF